MDWDKLRVFHAVAEAGSFTHAGETLHLSQSAVSRQISGLEESLNVPLFHRHARGLILTEQGEILYRTAHDVFAKLAQVKSRLTDTRDRPTGPLKVTTTVAFGSVWLTSRMREFIERFPDIEVSLVLADTELDISMRQADVAIRMTPPNQPDLVRRHLLTLRYHVFASPDYLKAHGKPKTAADLDNHDLIVYGEDAAPPIDGLNWLLKAGRRQGAAPRRPVLRVNSIYGIYRGVASGLGIGALPDYMSRETAAPLVEILPELRGPEIELFFAYPEELRNSARVVAFRDFLVEKMADGGLERKSPG